jgi:hypothetical protein
MYVACEFLWMVKLGGESDPGAEVGLVVKETGSYMNRCQLVLGHDMGSLSSLSLM